MTITKFSFPTTIHFGPGARKLAGPHLREHGLERPLVVTDRGLAALPLIAELRADLAAAGLEAAVFAGVFGNPTGPQAMAAAEAYRGHDADWRESPPLRSGQVTVQGHLNNPPLVRQRCKIFDDSGCFSKRFWVFQRPQPHEAAPGGLGNRSLP